MDPYEWSHMMWQQNKIHRTALLCAVFSEFLCKGLFLKKENGNFVNSIVYIIGWCNYDDVLKANIEKSYFRFNTRYHTNIAIPLSKLNSNDSFFNKPIKKD